MTRRIRPKGVKVEGEEAGAVGRLAASVPRACPASWDVTPQPCHSERSEESHRETLRFTPGDSLGVPIVCGLI